MGNKRRKWAVLSIATFAITLGPTARAEQRGIPNYVPISIQEPGSDSVVVERGDHLWSISAEYLEEQITRPPGDEEITPYWLEVIETNRDRLRSGDPDLIYPGEEVLLPDVG